jgi:hypothetical protein
VNVDRALFHEVRIVVWYGSAAVFFVSMFVKEFGMI